MSGEKQHRIFEETLNYYTLKVITTRSRVVWETDPSKIENYTKAFSFRWDQEKNDLVIENLPNLAQDFSQLALESIQQNAAYLSAVCRTIFSQPSSRGLVLKPLPNFDRTDEPKIGSLTDMSDFMLPNWIRNETSFVWTAPNANLEDPGVPYLMHRIVKENRREPNRVEWWVRQTGVDIPRESTALMKIRWDDPIGLENAAKHVLESDTDSNNTIRALSSDKALEEYRIETDYWQRYEKAWEESQPRDKRVSRQKVFDLLSRESLTILGKSCIASYYVTQHGFGGTKNIVTARRKTKGKMTKARNNIVSVDIYKAFSWSANRPKTEQDYETFLEGFAQKLTEEKIGFLVRYKSENKNNIKYVILSDPTKAREYIPLAIPTIDLTKPNAFKNWVEVWKNFSFETFDPETQQWVKI